MSLWSTLAKIGGIAAAPFTGGASLAIPAVLEAGGAMLGSASQASAQNRGAQIQADIEQERLRQSQEANYRNALLGREQEGRASRSDAWKQLQQAQYVANADGYAPPSVTSRGKPIALSAYGFGPKASTDVERQGASGLETEVMKRLMQGNQIPEIAAPSPFTLTHREPSIWERLAGIIGPGLSIYGAATRKDDSK